MFEDVLESFYQKTVNFEPLIQDVNERIQGLHNMYEIEYLELGITHFEQYMEGYLCFNCGYYSLSSSTNIVYKIRSNCYCNECIENIEKEIID